MRPAGAVLLLALLLAASARATPAPIEDLVADLSESPRRSAALNELRRRLDPAAVPLVLELVRTTGEPIVRYYGVLVLDAYPAPMQRKAFRSLLREEDPYLRLSAGTALYRQGARDMVPVIVAALTQGDIPPGTLSWMLNRLTSIATPEIAEAVRSLVVPGCDGTELSAALWWLSRNAADSSLATVAGMLEDPRPGVRAMAAAFLYRHGEEERAELLAELLHDESIAYSEFYRVKLFLEQSRRVADGILDALVDVAGETKQALIAQRAIEILSRFRYAKAIPTLRELLDHENEQVAKAAFEALAELSGGLNPETLRPLLDAEDPSRRLWAADALRRMDDRVGLPIVLEILDKGELADRTEAAKILGGFRVPAAVDALLPALSDPSSGIRYAAYNSLVQILNALFPYRRLDLASTGYQANLPPAETREAAARIRRWWEENRGKDW